MKRRTHNQALATSLLLLIMMGVCARYDASAHGGGALRLTAAPAGPYLLTAWLSPQGPKAGQELHITTAVELGSEPVLDAEVLIQVTDADTGAHAQSAAATRDQSVNKLLYEADLIIEDPGAYLINISVSGLDGQGSNGFAVDIQPAAGVNWLPVLSLSFALVLIFGLYRRGKRRPAVRIKPS
jgi:hypothetical protein